MPNSIQLLSVSFSGLVEAGTDEAGRGCLAGPVTAAAVILPSHFHQQDLNDSKQLSSSLRSRLKEIIESSAIAYAISHVEPEKIDRYNILNASIMAMHQALEDLHTQPEFIIVDGNRFKSFKEIPFECIIKGDSKFQNIAAASVLAKTYRDAYMERLHEEFPLFNWKKNKGYPTSEHRDAIRKYGITPYHRKSFRLLPEQLEFDF
ncbi:MAG: ribonuclease HII [Flavobacteriaceae bacterium]